MTGGLDVSRLSPGDCSTSFRSFARRFRGLFLGFEDDESPDALLNRPGPEGRSAADVAAATGGRLAAVDEALRTALAVESPDVSLEEVRDRPAATAQEALDLVTGAAGRLADRIDGVDAGDWRRAVTVDGREMTILDLVRQGVLLAAEGHQATERALEDARRAIG